MAFRTIFFPPLFLRVPCDFFPPFFLRVSRRVASRSRLICRSISLCSSTRRRMAFSLCSRSWIASMDPARSLRSTNHLASAPYTPTWSELDLSASSARWMSCRLLALSSRPALVHPGLFRGLFEELFRGLFREPFSGLFRGLWLGRFPVKPRNTAPGGLFAANRGVWLGRAVMAFFSSSSNMLRKLAFDAPGRALQEASSSARRSGGGRV